MTAKHHARTPTPIFSQSGPWASATTLALIVLSTTVGCSKQAANTPAPRHAGAASQSLGTAATHTEDRADVPAQARAGEAVAQDARRTRDAAHERVAPGPAPSLGTVYGERLRSSVTETPFTRRDERRPLVRFDLGYADPAGAFAPYAPWSRQVPTYPATLEQRGVSVTLVDERGAALPATVPAHRGVLTAVGSVDQRYGLVVRNHTDQRFEVVASVDGLDVIDGTYASYAHDGYVLEAHGTLEITGWRTDWDTVAAFRFADVPDSYGARTGRPHNVGAIGLAFFDELAPPAGYTEPAARPWVRRPVSDRAPDPFPGN